MARLVEETIQQWAATPCGRFPCGQDVLAYMGKRTGQPVPRVPAHQSRQELVKLLRPYGGLQGYAKELLGSMCWQSVSEPVEGDVGIIQVAPAFTACAISTRTKWVFRGDQMVIMIAHYQIKALNIWRPF